jgi:hypothetical protein
MRRLRSRVPKNLRLSTINCQSIVNKANALTAHTLCYKPDIVALTETWLHNDVDDNAICPDGYRIIRCDRLSRGGGVALIHKEDLNVVCLDKNPDDEFLVCQLNLTNNRSIVIVVSYRAPQAAPRHYDVLHASIDNVIASSKNIVGYIITGDFNFPDIEWTKDDPLSSNSEHDLYYLMEARSLTQIARQPTRDGAFLDLVFVSPMFVHSKSTTVSGIGDHSAIITDLQTPPMSKRSCRKKLFYDFSQANLELISNYFARHLPSFAALAGTLNDINHIWRCFKQHVMNCLDLHVPKRYKLIRKRKPWINRNIIHLKRKCRRLRRRKNSSNSDEHLRAEISVLERDIRALLDNSEKRFMDDMYQFLKTDPEKFWSHMQNKQHEDLEFLQDGNMRVTDKTEIANILNKHFASVFSESHASQLPPKPELRLEVSREGVKKLLEEIKPKKSPGPDSIPNAFLKLTSDTALCDMLCMLFNRSLELSVLPDEWKVAKVRPIFKSGTRSNPTNYRPISLTSQCSKLLEHIVAKQIITYLEANNKLSNKQHGFRKNFSTVTQLVEFDRDVVNALNDRNVIDCIFLDFSKAFDRVPHDILVEKMVSLGIDLNIVHWIQNFLSQRKQFVTVDDAYSSMCEVKSGVPQGSVVSPVLFLLFVDDLVENLESVARLFADDCVLYREITCQEDHAVLQRDLVKISEWCTKNRMSLNVSKTKHLMITSKHQNQQYAYSINGTQVESCTSYKYLGVTVTQNYKFNLHIDNIVAKANRALYSIMRKLKRAPHQVKDLAYKTYVRPILEYASPMWQPHSNVNITKIESVQRRAARFVSNNFDRVASVTSMLRELNWDSIRLRHVSARVKLLYCVINNSIGIDGGHSISGPSHFSMRLDHTRKLKPLSSNIDLHKFSFFPHAIKLWNSLPNSVVTSGNSNLFETLFMEWARNTANFV